MFFYLGLGFALLLMCINSRKEPELQEGLEFQFFIIFPVTR